MTENILTAAIRLEKGKNANRRLRATGFVPAIFYGANYETTHLKLKTKDLEQVLSRRRGLVNLVIEGKGEFEVIVREVQRDPASDKIQHLDLMGITRGQKMTSTVIVQLVGEPIGVKTGGGVLELHSRHLQIECLPKDLPEQIEVDVSALKVGDAVHVEDLKLENITILHSPKTTIASVAAPTVIKAAEAAPAPTEAEPTAETEEETKEE
jgi:large subunit ribosomal protein L25